MSEEFASPRAVPNLPAPHGQSGSGGSGGSGGVDISPKFLFHVFRLWWCYAVPAGLLLGAAVAAGIWASSTEQYEAKASVAIFKALPVIPGGGTGTGEVARKQGSVITSQFVLGPVVSRPEIVAMREHFGKQIDPVDVLASMISVVHDGGDLYLVKCKNQVPGFAAQIVNAVVDSYKTQSEYFANDRADELLKQLSAEITAQESQVSALQKQVAQLGASLADANPRLTQGLQSAADLHPIEELSQKLMFKRLEAAMLSSQIKAEEQRSPEELALIGVVTSPALAAMDQEMALLKDKIDRRKRIFRDPNDSELVRDEKKLASLEAQRTQVEEETRELSKEKHAAEFEAKRKENLAKLREQHQHLEQEIEQVEKLKKDAIDSLGSRSDDHVAHALALMELSAASELLAKLNNRHLTVTLERGRGLQVKVLRPATVPTYPVERAPLKKMVAGGAAGFLVPFAICVLWELRSRRLVDSREIAGRMAPVIGEVAALPLRRRDTDRAMRIYEDSVDNLRTYISLRWRDEKAQVFAVCSAATGEGKTTLASQLASSIARTKGNTLLIDGDLRVPDLQALFQTDCEFGLVDVLKGEAKFEDAISHWDQNLDVMPAGELDVNPHELFHGGGFEELLAWARERYDYIVIDTPPVLAATEALVVARNADQTIVCAMRDVSRVDRVQASHQRLVSAGANVCGVVFSGVSRQSYNRRYGDYYNQY